MFLYVVCICECGVETVNECVCASMMCVGIGNIILIGYISLSRSLSFSLCSTAASKVADEKDSANTKIIAPTLVEVS